MSLLYQWGHRKHSPLLALGCMFLDQWSKSIHLLLRLCCSPLLPTPIPVLSTCVEVHCWLNLWFTPGSNVAEGASIIQLARTIEPRLAPQLPFSRQIRQHTKLFMTEEWKDGEGWNWTNEIFERVQINVLLNRTIRNKSNKTLFRLIALRMCHHSEYV